MLLLSRKDNNCTWHLTHYIWHHSHSICACNTRCIVAITTIMEVIPLGTWMTSYTLYMTSQSLFMTPFLSIYGITATAIMTSDPLHMTSPPGLMTSHSLYLWHQRHYVCEYISAIFIIKHTVQRQYNHYVWNHNFQMCICVITPSVSMIYPTLYWWHGT